MLWIFMLEEAAERDDTAGYQQGALF